MSRTLGIVLGTRPEIIKLAPVIRACESREIPFTLIHTGQHYSDELDSVFFERLELPEPDIQLDIGSGSHGDQTGRMLIAVESALETIDADFVIVQGDTNSTLAGAMAAAKMEPEIAHVEAGLRSRDRSMPEEINRIVTDHVADRLFAPTDQARGRLLAEGISAENISVTGNTIVDAVTRHRELAREQSSILESLELNENGFFLLTAHRPRNVDDPDRFQRLLNGVDSAAAAENVPVLYPIHPRAERRINEFGLTVPDRIRLVDPVAYLDFLKLESGAAVILTDSGGVQEEACILGVPCVTIRPRTERPETIEVGANTLCGPDPDAITHAVKTMRQRSRDWTNPFGDGTAGERIVTELSEERTILPA